MKTEILVTGDQLVGAVLNGIYQGVIIVLLVALGLRFLGRTTNAATRHAIWFSTLLLLVLIIPAHFLRGYHTAANEKFGAENHAAQTATLDDAEFEYDLSDALPVAAAAEVPQPEAARTAPESATRKSFLVSFESTRRDSFDNSAPSFALPLDAVSPRPLKEASVDDWASLEHSWLAGVPIITVERAPFHNVEIPVPSPAPPASMPDSELSGEAHALQLAQMLLAMAPAEHPEISVERAETPETWNALKAKFDRWAAAAANPVAWKLKLGAKFPRTASLVLLAVWFMIAGAKVALLLLRLQGMRILKRTALPPGTQLNDLFQSLRAALGAARMVELKVSTIHRSPVLLGFFRPAILLPAELALEEAEPVLRHELAHVRRRDDWVNLIQHFTQAIFFFHPGIWWISKQLTLEREIACDDEVLQQNGHRRAYALLLANLAGRMQGRPLLAPGVSTHKGQLQQRIDMILDTKRDTSPRLAKARLGLITSTAALLAIAAIYSAPRVVLAQTPPAPPAPAAAPAAPVLIFNAPDALPGTPAPPSVSAGPKYKPSASAASSAQRAIIATTPAPAVPVTPAPPAAVTIAPVAPVPMIAMVQTAERPRLPRAARAGDGDSSLEERLARLEQLVGSLVAQQKDKNVHVHLNGPDGLIDRKEMAKIEDMAKNQAEMAKRYAINPKEIEKIKEMAERQAKMAVDQARAGADQAKRAAKEMEKTAKADQKRQFEFKFKDGAREGRKAEVENLRRQLQALERQRENLDRQIERLEQKQEQLDEQQDEEANSEDQSNDSKPECTAPKP